MPSDMASYLPRLVSTQEDACPTALDASGSRPQDSKAHSALSVSADGKPNVKFVSNSAGLFVSEIILEIGATAPAAPG